MYRITLALALLVFVLTGAGCDTKEQSTFPASQDSTVPLARLAGSRVALDDAASFKLGTNTIRFKMFESNGRELVPDDLKIQHEKKVHLLLVRDDMTGFQHLHPEYTDGKWAIDVQIPEQGEYNLYIDIYPNTEGSVVLRSPITVGGKTLGKKEPAPRADFAAVADGYSAVLTPGQMPLRTQVATKITYTLTNDGKTVEKIEPYLGAFGHVVQLRHNSPDDFFHVHPLTEKIPMNGQVAFEALFPVRGRYTLYAQFNIGGKIHTFPITVDVKEIGMTDPSGVHGGAHR